MKIEIKSEKGIISTNINIPKEPNGSLIVFCPGFLDSKDYYSFNYFGKNLSKIGYLTIAFDPIGTWKSGGTIKDYNFTNYLDNISSVIKYVKENNLKVKKFILIGHSRGASLSIIYSSLFGGVDEIIAIEPPIEVKEIAWNNKVGIRVSKRDDPFNKEKFVEFRVPYSFLEDSEKYDLIKLTKKVKTPVYFIAGEFDDVIDKSIVKELFDGANEPKEFFVLKIGHDFRHSKKETEIVFEKIKEILNK